MEGIQNSMKSLLEDKRELKEMWKEYSEDIEVNWRALCEFERFLNEKVSALQDTYKCLLGLDKDIDNLRELKRQEILRQFREIGRKEWLTHSAKFRRANQINEPHSEKKEDALNGTENVVDATPSHTIVLGSIVLLYDRETKSQMKYTIVDTSEVNSQENLISDESPLGKALLGKKKGDVVKIRVADCETEYEVLDVEGILFRYEDRRSRKGDNLGNGGIAEVREISHTQFITRVNVFKCTNAKHKVIDVCCSIDVMNHNGEVYRCMAPGGYCKECDRYFILEEDYRKLKEKGILMCKVVEQDFWVKQEKQMDYTTLKPESVLHMMGYNVNILDNLTEKQRRNILKLIVDEGILSVAEIRSHLQWLIKGRSETERFSNACLKWAADSEFIEKYGIEKRMVIAVDTIVARNYQSRASEGFVYEQNSLKSAVSA